VAGVVFASQSASVIADRRLDWEGRATWTFLGSLEELRPARGRQL